MCHMQAFAFLLNMCFSMFKEGLRTRVSWAPPHAADLLGGLLFRFCVWGLALARGVLAGLSWRCCCSPHALPPPRGGRRFRVSRSRSSCPRIFIIVLRNRDFRRASLAVMLVACALKCCTLLRACVHVSFQGSVEKHRLCWGFASEPYLAGDCTLLIVNFACTTYRT